MIPKHAGGVFSRRYPEYSVTGVASKELENVIASTDLPHEEDEA